MIRAFWTLHSRAALAFLVCALAVRALVPQGYMVSSGPMMINVTICYDGIDHETVELAIPMKRDNADRNDAATDHCAFSALSMAALDGADPVQLADALAYIVRTEARGTVSPVVPDAPYIRPPLRGPPARA
ncbi:MAG: hypothetical protein MUF41_06470 [Sphingopyxis sp.]|nr:hypothetical protein [Sphingopyxis sp.]